MRRWPVSRHHADSQRSLETAPRPAAGCTRLVISSTTLSVILEIVSLTDRGAIDLGEVRRDLPGGQTLGRSATTRSHRPRSAAAAASSRSAARKAASVSRGTSISTGPISVSTVFDRTRYGSCRGCARPGRACRSRDAPPSPPPAQSRGPAWSAAFSNPSGPTRSMPLAPGFRYQLLGDTLLVHRLSRLLVLLCALPR